MSLIEFGQEKTVLSLNSSTRLDTKGKLIPLEWDVLQDDDWVLGRILFKERLAGLAVAGEGDVSEGLFVAEVLDRRDHVGLEVVPPQAELLLVAGRHLVSTG